MTPRVLTVAPKDVESCLQWRTWWPSNALREHGYVADYMDFQGDFWKLIEPQLASGKYDLIVTPRLSFSNPWMTEVFEYTVRKYDLTWVYECDDDLFSPEIVQHTVDFGMIIPDNAIYEAQERAIRLRVQADDDRIERVRMLGMVDGVTTSTEALAEVVRQYTSAPIYVVPNAIDEAAFTEALARKERFIANPTVGWSGGWRRDRDLDAVGLAWQGLSLRFAELHFVLHGWAPTVLMTAAPLRRMHLLPWTPLADYPATLKNIDIACCSVDDTPWNLCKSAIKWYEMTLAGIPCVASHALYGREITDGYDGLLASTPDEWEAQLARLTEDAALRRTLQLTALDTIRREHSLATTWHLWRDAWSAIVDARSSSERGRVPVASAE